jgi:hypothetical protein
MTEDKNLPRFFERKEKASDQRSGVFGMDLFGARREMVIDATAALVVLLVLTVLSVYKPRGLTPYGKRKQDDQRQGSVQDVLDSDARAVPIH